jgi:Na+-translocating ferredoxin:NAD+ oxidoreductase RnfA subunit
VEKMKFTKETLYRALRTFLQAAVGYIVANVALINFNDDINLVKSTVTGLVVSALAAGLAALMNLEDNYNDKN